MTPYWDPSLVITEDWWDITQDAGHMLWVVLALHPDESRYLCGALISMLEALGAHGDAEFGRIRRRQGAAEIAWMTHIISRASPHPDLVRTHLPWSRIGPLLGTP